jgi:hypothetical protein
MQLTRSEIQRKYYDANRAAIMTAQRERRKAKRSNGKRSCYLAAPMTDCPGLNFSAFDRARDKYAALGYDVRSPADNDRANGLDPDADTTSTTREWYAAMYRWDMRQLLEVDAIVMLPGWRDSRGATTEHGIAVALGLQIIEDSGAS